MRTAKTDVVRMIMTEKIESFASRKLANESNGATVMTTQNILRESRVLKNVMQDPKQKQSDLKEEEDLKEEKEEVEEKEEQHRSFSRTGNDLIETDDELVEVIVITTIIIVNTITIFILVIITTVIIIVVFNHHHPHDLIETDDELMNNTDLNQL